jgi:hypothetical protein
MAAVKTEVAQDLRLDRCRYSSFPAEPCVPELATCPLDAPPTGGLCTLAVRRWRAAP